MINELNYTLKVDVFTLPSELRAKYFNTSAAAFRKLIRESIETNHLGKTELISLYTKHLKQFPNLVKGHNQAIFKIKFFVSDFWFFLRFQSV